MPLIGQITLNISLCIYLVWLVPQIFLNFRRKNTAGLSLLMHGILYIAYFGDLIYGFGRHMQWQYRMVTLVGLCSLSIQHYQFFYYGLKDAMQKRTYMLLSSACLGMLGYALFAITMGHHSKNFYDIAGMLANLCWLSYLVPQIIKNYRNGSTQGISLLFVFFSILLNCCDSTSAWAFNWDYPSKIGPAVSLLGNVILLMQVYYYAKKYNRIGQLATDS